MAYPPKPHFPKASAFIILLVLTLIAFTGIVQLDLQAVEDECKKKCEDEYDTQGKSVFKNTCTNGY